MKIQITKEINVPGLGPKIKAARKHDSRSLEDICGAVGITRMHWHRIEKEEVKFLPVTTLDKIQKTLGVEFVKLDPTQNSA